MDLDNRNSEIKIGIFSNPWIALSGYICLTVIFTWPLIIKINGFIPGVPGDNLQNLWNLWWLKEAILSFKNPYFCDIVFAPDGVPLYFHTLNPFNGILALPFSFLFSWTVCFNIVVLFSFIASGFFMYLLVRKLTGHGAAAFIAGIIFTFGPYHMGHSLGHLQLIAMEWLPVFIYLILSVREKITLSRLAGANISFVLAALCSWYFAVYLMLTLFILWLYDWRIKGRSFFKDKSFIHLPLAVVGAILVLSPIWINLLYQSATVEFLGTHPANDYSADLLSFFLPGGQHTVFGTIFKPVWSRFSGNVAENSNYLGWTVIILAILALKRAKIRTKGFWLTVGIVSFIWALGPTLHVAGNYWYSHGGVLPLGSWAESAVPSIPSDLVAKLNRGYFIPLPYLFLDRTLPFFKLAGLPERVTILLVISISVLSAYGVCYLSEKYPRYFSGSKIKIGYMLVIVLIIFEYYSFPLAMTEVNDKPLPKTNKLFESNPGRNVIFDISIPPDLVMANQIRHGLPLYAGSVSRTPVVYADRLEIRDRLNGIAGKNWLKIMGNADFSGEISGFNPENMENVIYLSFVYDAVDDLHKTYRLKYFDVYGSILEKQQGIFLNHWEIVEADEKEAFRILKKKR